VPAGGRCHALGDGQRQPGDVRQAVDCQDPSGLWQLQRSQPAAGRHLCLQHTAAARVIAAPWRLHLQRQPQAGEQGHGDLLQIIERRRSAHVGAADQAQPGAATVRRQYRQQGVQHQDHVAGGTDVDGEFIAQRRARPEGQRR
jgi:hypothetical protein